MGEFFAQLFDTAAYQNRTQLDTQCVGELAALTHKLQGRLGESAFPLLGENPDLSVSVHVYHI